MLTPGQITYYETFGFLHLPGLFREEIGDIERAAEAVWQKDDTPTRNDERRVNFFIEQSVELTRLVVHERVYPVIEQLIGPDFIWVGSEGNISARSRVNWHADRKYYREGEEQWIDYQQIKLMMYLDPVTRDTGCLRVIPGSHRMPLHKDLAAQETNAASEPFGLDGPDIPCAALESTPGDAILFNHCTWHAAYGGHPNRRYVAMKFAAKPTADDQLVSLERYTPKIFEPHAAFLEHNCSRIRALVEALPKYGSQKRI
jgi:ectoine hydroxylase-related dioxygenase (phytanoyl-CoA dioxygenase family)